MSQATDTREATADGSSPGSPVSADVFVARQAIFDRATHVFGYELLFRSRATDAYDGQDGVRSSVETIHRAVHSLGLSLVAGTHKIFVNFPEKLLLDEFYTVLPPDRLVVELLETSAVNGDLLQACRKLKDAGYTLALDDFRADNTFGPLLELADIIKVDFRTFTEQSRRLVVSELSHYPAKLLAEKIETPEEFKEATDLGCMYAQGYFFCKPELMHGRALAGVSPVYADFLRELHRQRLDFDRLETAIKCDPSLSYKLLRYLNSAAVGLRHRVTSVKQALVLMGEGPVRKWGSLAALTNIAVNKPAELLSVCLSRARFCESIASACRMADSQLDLFLIGLLSGFDAALDMPMHQVLAQVSLPAAVRSVLLHEPQGHPSLAHIFELVLECERGAWSRATEIAGAIGLTQAEVSVCYYESLLWADDVLRRG